MKQGYLSQYFRGIGAKVLSAVEVNTALSNQHEYNGVTQLKQIFGTERKTFSAQFLYLDDSDDEPVKDIGFLTWYDAREAHPIRTEYRFYFSTTAVSDCASVGDVLFVGLRPNDTVIVIVAEAESTICNQLLWLFGIKLSQRFEIRDNLERENDRLAYSSKMILKYLDIQVEENGDYYLEEMLNMFGGNFPTTSIFSTYARKTLKDVHPQDNPDWVLIEWVEREELLFRTLEKHFVSQRLAQGFESVDDFFSYSLSVQNRRKSRAGQSLENHIEQLLKCNGISYSRTQITENKSKPDFIFPSIDNYHDNTYDSSKLHMLGVKSTCKDRWRQVLSEADRISQKHLLTLEAAISVNQTNQMELQKLQLVVPSSIQSTYSELQKSKLMSVFQFLEIVRFDQRA